MNIWVGEEINTGFKVEIHDAPLSIRLYDVIQGTRLIFQHSAIQRMCIATSSMLGTAVHARMDDGEGGVLVVEAAPPRDIIRGDYMAAMAEARQQVESEIELERAWNAPDTADADIERLIRDGLRVRRR